MRQVKNMICMFFLLGLLVGCGQETTVDTSIPDDYLNNSYTSDVEVMEPQEGLSFRERRQDHPEAAAQSDLQLQQLSTQAFTELAAREYVSKFKEVESKGAEPSTASIVAVAHITDMARRAKLKLSLRDVSDINLQKVSKKVIDVELLLTGRIKPSRTAAMAKQHAKQRAIKEASRKKRYEELKRQHESIDSSDEAILKLFE